jgi:hypothetical protein
MRSPKFLQRVSREEQRVFLEDDIIKIHDKHGWPLKHDLKGMSIKQLRDYLNLVKKQHLRVIK